MSRSVPPRPTTGATPRRGRRGARPSGDDREQAILATAERLLDERRFSELSIDELARGAGISRPSFYFYFPSKDAVLLTLIDRVVAEADAAAFDPRPAPGDDPTDRWRTAIEAFFRTFRAHRPVVLAWAQARTVNPEVQRLWGRVLDNWVRRTEDAIIAERTRGAAPPGPPAHELAIALNLMNERVMYASFAGERPAIDEARVVDTLLAVWLSSIYQDRTPG